MRDGGFRYGLPGEIAKSWEIVPFEQKEGHDYVRNVKIEAKKILF